MKISPSPLKPRQCAPASFQLFQKPAGGVNAPDRDEGGLGQGQVQEEQVEHHHQKAAEDHVQQRGQGPPADCPLLDQVQRLRNHEVRASESLFPRWGGRFFPLLPD